MTLWIPFKVLYINEKMCICLTLRDSIMPYCYGQGEVRSNDNTTRKWVIRNILKENSTYINDSWEKPLLSLTQSWILPFLVTACQDCAEESLASICHMRASPSVGETPQHLSKWCTNKNLSLIPFNLITFDDTHEIAFNL